MTDVKLTPAQRRDHRLLWGAAAHLVADWLLQNEWMALNKMRRRSARAPWWDRHPSAYVHSGVHAVALAPTFGVIALPLGIAHLLIDLRTPVSAWSRLIGQTQPVEGFDIGADVRIWNDQVWHLCCIAIAARLTDRGREVIANG